MMPVNCEYVRDLLPDLIGGRLSAPESTGVQAHLQTCADCRAELAIVTAVSNARLYAPVGMQPRIVRNLRGRVAVKPRWSAAMAASIAIAVIGGSALLGPLLRKPETLVTPGPSDAAEPASAGWFSVDDAFISGASSLGDLTVEELKQLLVELDT